MELRHPHSSFPCTPALVADESTTQYPDAKNSHLAVSGLEAIACESLTYFFTKSVTCAFLTYNPDQFVANIRNLSLLLTCFCNRSCGY